MYKTGGGFLTAAGVGTGVGASHGISNMMLIVFVLIIMATVTAASGIYMRRRDRGAIKRGGVTINKGG